MIWLRITIYYFGAYFAVHRHWYVYCFCLFKFSLWSINQSFPLPSNMLRGRDMCLSEGHAAPVALCQ